MVNPKDVESAIGINTRLVSIMQVNNEVGSIQRIAEISQITSKKGVLLHTDAVQGIGYLDADVHSLNVDLLSLSAHKIFGPKGAGALFIRNNVKIQPMIHGGPQESGIRPGTENIPGIVGLGQALQLTSEKKKFEFKRLAELRTWFIEKIKAAIPGVLVNGSTRVSPHILSISFPDAIAEMMQFHLHTQGVAVSLGSACTSKDIEPSHVLQAMGIPMPQIEGTLRISFGYPTTQNELNKVLELLPDIWRRSRIS
jgi:cysteine desulfurase